MIIGAFSDSHAHAEKRVSDIGLSDKEWKSEILEAYTTCDILYGLGDLVDPVQSKWYSDSSRQKALHNTFKKYHDTFEITAIKGNQFVWIQGNHDAWEDGRPKRIIFETERRSKILLEHGVHDYMCKNWPNLVDFLAWISGWLERIVSPAIETDSKKWVRKLLGIELLGNWKQIRYLKELIDEDDSIEVGIFGHTHKAQIVKFMYKNKPRIYINVGFFNAKQRLITYFDTETYKIAQSHNNAFDYTNFTKKLKYGDVILTGNKSDFISASMKFFTASKFSHSMVYVGKGKVIESTGETGVSVNPLHTYLEGNHAIKVKRLHNRSKVKLFVKNMLKHVGARYGWFQIVGDFFIYGIERLLNWFFGTKFNLHKKVNLDCDPEVPVCSELIVTSLNETYGCDKADATSSPQTIDEMNMFYDILVA